MKKFINQYTVLIKCAFLALLSFCVGLSAQPIPTAISFSGGGDGSELSPYLIATVSDLSELSALVNVPSTNVDFADKHYRLVANIDLSDLANWSPIGIGLIRTDDSIHPLTFRGVFDGNGNKIINLKTTSVSARSPGSFYGQGLFGVVDGGTVKNLLLDSVVVDIKSTPVVGGLVGAVVNGGVVANVNVSGKINGGGSVGGIAGHVDYGSMIEGSNFVGNVNGSFRVGGIAGHVYSNGVISGCHVTGSINSTGSAGDIAGSIWNSVITGSHFNEANAFPDISTPAVSELAEQPAVSHVSITSSAPSKFTAGPNPVSQTAGGIAFFWHGGAISGGKLSIYNVSGKFVKKVKISDKPVVGDDKRRVGSWDLRDAKGRPVSEGAYLVKGAFKVAGGREKVSAAVGVRR